MKNEHSFLFAGTRQGLLTLERQADAWRETARGLTDRTVTSVIAREAVILAGTTNGIFRSDDSGQTWAPASHGLTTEHVRWLAFHPDFSDFEFAGTEPAGIFVSHDGGGIWRECPEVTRLRDKHRWFLPYSPAAGCVRGFAFHGQRAYAAVEVGGVLCSDDGGDTWQLAEGSTGNPDLAGAPPPFIYPDVHSLAAHPSSSDLVFAATGGGLYRTSDGGKTWALLYDCYVRAVWVNPADAQHLVLGPAEDVESNGRIEETRDGGQTWRAISTGTPWPDKLVERFEQVGTELFAVLSSGELLVAPLATLEWRHLPTTGQVNAVTAMHD
jgi:photosystem II stability/assembly factor-like uncharacterized protein